MNSDFLVHEALHAVAVLASTVTVTVPLTVALPLGAVKARAFGRQFQSARVHG
jgi:hypothetical protein